MSPKTLHGARIGTLDVEILTGDYGNIWSPKVEDDEEEEAEEDEEEAEADEEEETQAQEDPPLSAFHHPWRENIQRLRVDVTRHLYGSTVDRVLEDLMMDPGAHMQDEVWYTDPRTWLRTLRQTKWATSPEQLRPNQRLIVGCREDALLFCAPDTT